MLALYSISVGVMIPKAPVSHVENLAVQLGDVIAIDTIYGGGVHRHEARESDPEIMLVMNASHGKPARCSI